MYKGSCLCGTVSFELLAEPSEVSHCHCKMCQKQHGAAFGTYASVLIKDFVYLTGAEYLSSYNSSGSIERKFCSKCGSSIEWSGSKKFPDWVSIAAGCFDTPFKPKKIDEHHLESKVCWHKSGNKYQS